jgi:hypothetical protein
MPLLKEKKLKEKKFFQLDNNIHNEAKQLMKTVNKNFEIKKQKELDQGVPNIGGARVHNMKFDKEIKRKMKLLLR